jgi:hypothetical protein
VALLYPNLRDAEPFRISEKAISGEEVSQLGPEKRGISYTCHISKSFLALTVSYTLAAAPVIARGFYSLDREGLGIHGQPAQGHGAPALSIRALLACAAGPAATFTLELAVLERTVSLCGLGCREGHVAAGRLIARLEIDERRRAVVPVNGCMGAGVVSRMAVTHCDCLEE